VCERERDRAREKERASDSERASEQTVGAFHFVRDMCVRFVRRRCRGVATVATAVKPAVTNVTNKRGSATEVARPRLEAIRLPAR